MGGITQGSWFIPSKGLTICCQKEKKKRKKQQQHLIWIMTQNMNNKYRFVFPRWAMVIFFPLNFHISLSMGIYKVISFSWLYSVMETDGGGKKKEKKSLVRFGRLIDVRTPHYTIRARGTLYLYTVRSPFCPCYRVGHLIGIVKRVLHPPCCVSLGSYMLTLSAPELHLDGGPALLFSPSSSDEDDDNVCSVCTTARVVYTLNFYG